MNSYINNKPNESNPVYNNKAINSYYYHIDENNISLGTKKPLTVTFSYSHADDNNSILARIAAWELLSREKRLNPSRFLTFDQDLCQFLVQKYGLSCSDCKLDCPQHTIEDAK